MASGMPVTLWSVREAEQEAMVAVTVAVMAEAVAEAEVSSIPRGLSPGSLAAVGPSIARLILKPLRRPPSLG